MLACPCDSTRYFRHAYLAACSLAFSFNLPAEEVRKLKSRVEDLEKINGGLLAINQGNSKIEKDVSRVDFLHGISPSSTFPYENEESIWLMVKSRLNKEIERGEQSQKMNPYLISPATFVSKRKVIYFSLADDGKRLTIEISCICENKFTEEAHKTILCCL